MNDEDFAALPGHSSSPETDPTKGFSSPIKPPPAPTGEQVCPAKSEPCSTGAGGAALVFGLTEGEVSRLTGLSKGMLRAARRDERVTEGVDWRLEGARVMWSEAGVRRVMLATGTDMTEETDSSGGAGRGVSGAEGGEEVAETLLAQKEAPAKAQEAEKGITWLSAIEVLTVKRLVLNRRILVGTDGKGEYRVQVRDSVNFVVGMRVPVRHVQADLFSLVGRCPRWRGKW